ncbi:hypothetical protein RintRC_7384 [Richelia intracellularis]|nr:hypothetical protein RintRC_7384 [Richelia intracellularis]
MKPLINRENLVKSSPDSATPEKQGEKTLFLTINLAYFASIPLKLLTSYLN